MPNNSCSHYNDPRREQRWEQRQGAESTETVPGGGAPCPQPPTGDGSHGDGAPGKSGGEGSGPQGRLDNIAIGSSSTDSGGEPARRSEYQSRRRQRFDLRQTLWDVTGIERCSHCGRHRIDSDEQFKVVLKIQGEDSTATTKNVQTCGSVWACPVCAARKRQERAEELYWMMRVHLSDGGGIYSWTGTMRHGQRHSLEEGIEAMNRAWGNRVIAGSSWQRDREDFGIIGYVKAPDFTYGPNGWHPHMPVVFFTEEPLSEDEREELRQRIYERWCSGVGDTKLGEPYKVNCPLDRVEPDGHGSSGSDGGEVSSDEVLEDLPGYILMGLLKGSGGGPDDGRSEEAAGPRSSVSPEAAALDHQRHDMKRAGDQPGTDHYHFTPFELLKEIRVSSDPSQKKIDLWREYEDATHGLHSWYPSGLSDLRERAQEEAEEEEDVREVVLREIEPILWKVILRKSSVSRLLEVAEGLHEEDLNQFLGRMRARLLEMGPPL